MDLLEIEALARRMRRAIEDLPREILPSVMSNFPKGGCSNASLLLGAYLVDKGVDGFKLVWGWRGSKTHAWIAKNNLIIDITADQFPDAPTGMLLTRPSPWHEEFEIEGDSEPADFRQSPGAWNHEVIFLYDRLKPALFDEA